MLRCLLILFLFFFFFFFNREKFFSILRERSCWRREQRENACYRAKQASVPQTAKSNLSKHYESSTSRCPLVPYVLPYVLHTNSFLPRVTRQVKTIRGWPGRSYREDLLEIIFHPCMVQITPVYDCNRVRLKLHFTKNFSFFFLLTFSVKTTPVFL